VTTFRTGVTTRAIFLTVLLVLSSKVTAISGSERVPERLVYDLSWMGIPVGTAIQEISEQPSTRRITSFARSNGWLSAFYPVEDATESILAKKGSLFPGESRVFRMRFTEGSQTRDREISFKQDEKRAIYHDRISGETAVVPIEGEVFDIYAAFFYVRHLNLRIGTSVVVQVLDGKHQRALEVKVLRKEMVTSPAGTFSTVVIEPQVLPEGIFEEKYGVTLWLTDDERRIPVKARTRVRVGSVTALLVDGAY
jgi:hypothetical protein